MHAPESIRVVVDGREVRVPRGTVAAAAIARLGPTSARRSVTGQPRSALCGMGICQECRVTINEIAHVRGCLRLCEEGMEIRTDG